jgi:hypothetical protein
VLVLKKYYDIFNGGVIKSSIVEPANKHQPNLIVGRVR